MNSLSIILVELLPCLIIGFLLGNYYPKLSEFISKPLINYGAPISIAGVLLGVGIKWQLIKSAIFAALLMTIIFFLINLIPQLSKKIYETPLKISCAVSNTAYFGIPISLALLPPESFNTTIGFDLGSTLLTWTIGPFLLKTNDNSQVDIILKNFFKIFSSPAIKGIFLYFLICLTPFKNYIYELIWLPSKLILLLSLSIVGMILSSAKYNFKNKQLWKYPKLPLIIKLLIMPFIAFLISLFCGFNDYEIKALVIQSAGPSAISVLLISEAKKIKSFLLINQILMSTLLSIFTIPFILVLLNIFLK